VAKINAGGSGVDDETASIRRAKRVATARRKPGRRAACVAARMPLLAYRTRRCGRIAAPGALRYQRGINSMPHNGFAWPAARQRSPTCCAHQAAARRRIGGAAAAAHRLHICALQRMRALHSCSISSHQHLERRAWRGAYLLLCGAACQQ